MKDYNYFGTSFSLSIFTTIIYIFLIKSLEGVWLSVHLSLGVAYLLIILIGLYGMLRKKLWAPVAFLLLFAAQAIDGFYIFAQMRHWTVVIFTLLAIFALYRTVSHASVYKDMKKEEKRRAFLKKKKALDAKRKVVINKPNKKTTKKSNIKKTASEKVKKTQKKKVAKK